VKRSAPQRAALVDIRWGAPQLLLSLGVFLVALIYLFSVLLASPVSVAPWVELMTEPQQVQLEVAYAVVDVRGLERPAFAVRTLPLETLSDELRVNASLEALVEELQALGVWPDALRPPRAILLEVDRRRVVVVDVPPLPAGVQVGVSEELAVLRSLSATVRAAVASAELRLTVQGEEALTLWGSVALPR